ncbi:MAG: hypothetical protein WBW88_18525, partial [Rhodothermales bacterium]
MSLIRPILFLAVGLLVQPAAFAASDQAYSFRSGAAPGDSLEVQLLFDGKPLLSKKYAKFSCFDYGHDKWINCRIRPGDGVQRYVMARPGRGRYRMHIDIDENEDNPDMYPGDFSVVHMLEVGPGFQGPLLIDVPQLIHLTSPANNGRSIEGAFAACDRDPDYT